MNGESMNAGIDLWYATVMALKCSPLGVMVPLSSCRVSKMTRPEAKDGPKSARAR